MYSLDVQLVRVSRPDSLLYSLSLSFLKTLLNLGQNFCTLIKTITPTLTLTLTLTQPHVFCYITMISNKSSKQ